MPNWSAHPIFKTQQQTIWTLSKDLINSLAKDSLDRAPEEACGLLLGHQHQSGGLIEKYIPIPNISPTPVCSFKLDPATLVRYCYTPGLIGLYHCHPTAPALPSREDLKQLQLFGELFTVYAIGSLFPTSCTQIMSRSKLTNDKSDLNAEFDLAIFQVTRQDNGHLNLTRTAVIESSELI